MKKILIPLICVAAVVSLICGSAFSTSAETIKFDFKGSVSGWGTEEDGIIAPSPNSYPGYHTPWSEPGGHPNLDFEKGLMYWSTNEQNSDHPATGPVYPNDYVDIVKEENGNHYLTFTAENTYQGIESVPFVESRIDENDEICVVFKWKGDDPNFQIYVNQLRYKTTDGTQKDSKRVSHNGDAKRNEIIADGEDGWNVAFCKPETDSVKKPHDIMPYYIFQVGVEVQTDPSCKAIVDDIRLGKYSESNNVIYDLDGKVMYDLKNIDTVEGEDLLNEGMFPDINYNVTYDDVYGAKKSGSGSNALSQNNLFFKDGAPTVVFWIIIICGAVILIAGIAVVIVVIVAKKKKASDKPEEELAETTENPSEEQS